MKNINKVCYIPWIGTPLKNQVFNQKDYISWEIALNQLLKADNIEISTIDILPIKDADAIIMFDNLFYRNMKYIREMYKYDKLDKCIYIDYEPPTGHCRNHSKKELKKLSKIFKKVITYNDDIVDNKNIIKGCIGNFYEDEIKYKKDFKSRKFLTMITNAITIEQIIVMMNYYNWTTYFNKKNMKPHPKQIYSKRKEAALYFLKKCPEKFDLYGLNWEKEFNPILKGYLDKKKKCEVMSKYKFIISYDSMIKQNGYISEKIFDAFKAKTVPVYWGASNIEKYIPKECFIDKRNFKTYDELYAFLNNITEEEYEGYINAIENYLNSNTYHSLFSSQASAKIIQKCLLDEDHRSTNKKNIEKILMHFEKKNNKVASKRKIQYYINNVSNDATSLSIIFKFVDFLETKDINLYIKKNNTYKPIKKINIIEDNQIENSKIYLFEYTLNTLAKKDIIEIVLIDNKTNKKHRLIVEDLSNSKAKEIGLVSNKKNTKIIYYNYYSLNKLKKLIYLRKYNKDMYFKTFHKKFFQIKSYANNKLKKYPIIKYLIKIIYKLLRIPFIYIKYIISLFKNRKEEL